MWIQKCCPMSRIGVPQPFQSVSKSNNMLQQTAAAFRPSVVYDCLHGGPGSLALAFGCDTKSSQLLSCSLRSDMTCGTARSILPGRAS